RDYHRQLKEGTISCEAVVGFYLSQIEKSRHLNAFTAVFKEEALQRAVMLDAQRAEGKPMGKLHVPCRSSSDLPGSRLRAAESTDYTCATRVAPTPLPSSAHFPHAPRTRGLCAEQARGSVREVEKRDLHGELQYNVEK
ncbi:MAG: hypothetical protein BJ554DRAFT_1352, partial [Olpidium bornovanus]